MKVSEIIDCTCTVASISSISRFACANMWSVRVITSSIYVTFVRVRFAFVNICQKKEKKEKRVKNWIWFLFKSHKCTFIWKKWNTHSSNIQGKLKKKPKKPKKQKQQKQQNNNKQADKPKQNKTKIYKRANEEYITHAQ